MEATVIIKIHTPSSSLALVHNGGVLYLCKCYIQVHFIHSPVTTESLTFLFDKLSKKRQKRVGPGWLKYKWDGAVYNLDDGAFQCLFIR
jgi:hypothetical protein